MRSSGFLLVALIAGSVQAQQPIHHFVWFGGDRENIHTDTLFLNTPALEGAQILYPWRLLERGKGNYEFTEIREDLAFLKSKGKKLWIQLQDVSFSPSRVLVPQYLLNDPAYHGGVARTYRIRGDNDSSVRESGWVARRWDPAVQERFAALLTALGKQFDGEIEGINLPETSLEYGNTGKYFPQGYTNDVYRAAIKANMAALKKAFPKSIAMQYANFMPGEWRPSEDKGYLSDIYDFAVREKIAVGGPDLMPSRPGQMKSSYPLIAAAAGKTHTGLAVQDDNLAEIDPKTGKLVTVSDLLQFATNTLKLEYIFWGTQEPYYSRDIVPTLRLRSQATAKLH